MGPVIEVEAGGATAVQTKGGCSAVCLVILGILMYVIAGAMYGTAFFFAYNAQQNNTARPAALIYIFWALGGACGLTGLIFLIASCVKCCCTDQQTIVVDGTTGGVVSYEVGGAPVQGDVEVEVEVGSDTQFLGGVDVEMPKTDVEVEVEVDVQPEFEVEIEAPEVEIEIEAPEVEFEVEAPEVEIEVEVEVEAEVEVGCACSPSLSDAWAEKRSP